MSAKNSTPLCAGPNCLCDAMNPYFLGKHLDGYNSDDYDDIETTMFEKDKKFLITQRPLANYVILNPNENDDCDEEIPQVIGFYENNKIRTLTNSESNKALMRGWILRPYSFRPSDPVLPVKQESTSPENQYSSSLYNLSEMMKKSKSPENQYSSSLYNLSEIMKKFTFGTESDDKSNYTSNFAPTVQSTSACTSNNTEDKIFIKSTSACTSNNAENKISIKFGDDSLGSNAEKGTSGISCDKGEKVDKIYLNYNGEVSTSNSGAKMEKKRLKTCANSISASSERSIASHSQNSISRRILDHKSGESDRSRSDRLFCNLEDLKSGTVRENKRGKTSNQLLSDMLREKSLAAEKRVQEGAKSLFKEYTKMIEEFIDASEKKGIVVWEMSFSFVMQPQVRELCIKEGLKVSIHLNGCDVMATKVCCCKPLGPKYNNCFTVISWK